MPLRAGCERSRPYCFSGAVIREPMHLPPGSLRRNTCAAPIASGRGRPKHRQWFLIPVTGPRLCGGEIRDISSVFLLWCACDVVATPRWFWHGPRARLACRCTRRWIEPLARLIRLITGAADNRRLEEVHRQSIRDCDCGGAAMDDDQQVGHRGPGEPSRRMCCDERFVVTNANTSTQDHF